MADSRINLLSSASSTASDDFFVVDGNTNGTRKLNAFSPTFGGNATVTGTLTANGLLTAAATTSLDGLPTAAIFGATKRIAIGYNTSGDYGFIASADSGTTWKELHLNPSGGLVKVPSTSASTTTSSGALVVGNGTSGGLGVGGAINAGGLILSSGSTAGLGAEPRDGSGYRATWYNPTGDDMQLDFAGIGTKFTITSAGNTTLAGTLTVSGTGASSFGGRLAIGATALSDRMFYVSGSTGTTGASQFAAVVNPTIPNTVTTGAYGLYLGTNIAAGATVTNGYSLFIAAPDYTGSTVTNKYGLYSNDPNPSYFVGRVLIDNSTASTSTSIGALVVSGGVGVAGALYAANLGGTSTNNNAASGCIGEYTSATTAYASKVSLTSNTAANIVSISLTAGDWDVQFNPVFTQDTPLTTSGLLAGVSSSSATLPSGAAERAHSPSGPNGNSDISIAPPVTRISLASTTTIYGVATGIFSAGTMSAYGFIRARRVR